MTNKLIDELSKVYPALITLKEASEIARVPLATLHSWSSRGHFDKFKIRRGRKVLLPRDRFVKFLTKSNDKNC